MTAALIGCGLLAACLVASVVYACVRRSLPPPPGCVNLPAGPATDRYVWTVRRTASGRLRRCRRRRKP